MTHTMWRISLLWMKKREKTYHHGNVIAWLPLPLWDSEIFLPMLSLRHSISLLPRDGWHSKSKKGSLTRAIRLDFHQWFVSWSSQNISIYITSNVIDIDCQLEVNLYIILQLLDVKMPMSSPHWQLPASCAQYHGEWDGVSIFAALLPFAGRPCRAKQKMAGNARFVMANISRG